MSDGTPQREIAPRLKKSVHRITSAGSVQALAIDQDVLFAGLQIGTVSAYSLDTYELLSSIFAHDESVLSLTLSDDHELLFSTGADSVVKVWSAQSLEPLYSLYPSHEIGDIFCVAHSSRKQTAFFGAQNGSVSWHRLKSDILTSPKPMFSPVSRKHRFFDSRGPGGSMSALQRRTANGDGVKSAGHKVILQNDEYKAYAHNGYIYSMLLAKGLFRHDGEEEVLITAGGGGNVKLWKIDSPTDTGLVQLFQFKNKGYSAFSLAYSGSFLYVGLSEGTAHVYNLASCQLVQRLNSGTADVTQIQLSQNMICCGTSDGWIKRFSSQFLEVDAWLAHHGKILAMSQAQLEDRGIFLTGGNDNCVACWDVKDPEMSSIAEAAGSDDELLNALRQFVEYRTVSAHPRYAAESHGAVTWLRKRCSAFGATTSVLAAGEGIGPIFLAKFSASNHAAAAKTLLFYGHYDVVDAELDFNNWHGSPFSMLPLNGFLYGRGITDNKGPILAAIYAAANLAQRGKLSCNVTFLLEGDEEAGSRGFRDTVQAHHDEIGPVDYILLSNSYWLDDHIPCLTFGMRGVVHVAISVTNNRPDLHSGMDGKSVQHEPLKDLTVLLGALIGNTGTKVTVPGFYDSVDDLNEKEVLAYNTITSALLPGHPEIKNAKEFSHSLIQRWRYPNLTVHRIEVPEAKTAVTISGTAQAALSIRIVPSQTAEEVSASLDRYLHDTFAKLQSTCTLKVSITSKADPWLGETQSEIYQSLKDAIIDVWSPSTSAFRGRVFPQSGGETPETTPQKRPPHRRASSLASHGTFTAENTPHEPLFIREGGSIPAISFLEKEFDAPAAMFPMGQASDNAHLNNERMRVENLYKGREVLKKVFARL